MISIVYKLFHSFSKQQSSRQSIDLDAYLVEKMLKQQTKYKVYVTRNIMPRGIELMRKAGVQVDVYPHDNPIPLKELYAQTKNYDALLSMLTDQIDKNFIQQNTHLKVISNNAVGYNNIDIKEATLNKIPIGNTPGVLNDATADMAVALMLATARMIPQSMESIKRGEWTGFKPLGWIGQSMKNKTLGIVGMGRIGYEVGYKCHFGWDMKILYANKNSNHPEAESKLKATRVSLEELLQKSDFVTVHVPLTEDTKLMFNKERFALMKKTAIFINTSRGDIHNEKDLYEALKQKKIWGAGLDVTNPEPMSKDDPILYLDNIVIAPHIASAEFETRQNMSLLAARNILAGLLGEQLPNQVNKDLIVGKK